MTVQIITGGMGLLAAGLIIWLVRRDHLHADHGVGWLVVAGSFALLGFAPGIIDRIAHGFGIGYPPALGLSIAVIVLVVKTLLMDIERANIKVDNRRLTQRVGLLEAEIDALKRSRPESADTETGASRDSVDSGDVTGPAAESTIDHS